MSTSLAHRSCCTSSPHTDHCDRSLFRLSRDPVFISTLDGSLLEANPALLALVGGSQEEVRQRGLEELCVDPAEQGRIMALLRQEGSVRDQGMRLRCIDGERNVSLTACVIHPFEAGPPVVQGIVRDLSAHEEMERALCSSEQRFRAAFERAGIAMSILSPDGRFTSVNRRMCELTGYSRAELLERSFREITHPDDLEPGAVLLAELLCGRRDQVEIEKRYIRKDGAIVWGHTTATVVREADGRLVQGLAQIQDITERRRLEEERVERDRYYRALIENSTDLTGILEADGTVRYHSPALLPMLGYPPEELAGANAFERVHPEDREALVAFFTAGQAEPGKSATVQYRYRHRDGSWRVLESAATNLLHDPAVAGVVVNSRDVTERVSAEEEVRYQAHLLDSVQQAVIATDPEGKVRYWSRFAESLYGWSAAEAVGRGLLEVLSPEEGQEQGVEIMSALLSSRSWSGELVLRRRDGSAFRAEVANSPLRDARGRPIGLVGISTDVTQQRELEQQLRHAQRMEAVGRLAGGVAHDFNNLLTVIRGGAELVMMDLPAESPFRTDLADIRDAVERATRLTQQLLAFSRKQVLQPRRVDLGEAVSDVERMLGRLIGEDIRLVVERSPGLWTIRADPGQLEQVLLNLAVNARDAMPGGGRLSIGTRNVVLDAAAARRYRHPVTPGEYVELTVSDSGTGIPAEALPHIFEPFFTTKAQGKGTGLGLATVYGIVKQSGGYIWAESEPGTGATFRICLPRSLDAAEPGGSAAARSEAEGGSETILVVEDEPAVRSMVVRTLARAGYRVVEADGPVAALDLLAGDEPAFHLLLTDVIMPDLNGRELARLVQERRPDLRVLYMSGYTDDALVGTGVLSAGKELVSKPFAPDALLAAVRRSLQPVPGSLPPVT